MNPRKVKMIKKVGIHFLLDQYLDQWLTETAYKLQKTRTDIITEALIKYLNEVNPKEEKKESEKNDSV
jgi:metal-responsive CopG/Arc/MetJ family transcriptional regulator